MRFAYPQILFLLMPAGLILAAFMVWAWNKKQRLIRLFVQERLLPQLTAGVSTARQKARLVMLGLAVIGAALALARPQWGFAWEEARQRGLDIMVAIDTSRSMLADDLRPNRLERAKLAALDLMRLAESDRLGLVPFAGSAFLQCPLTLDAGAFQQNIQALGVGIMPQGGTALAEAIRVAQAAFKDSADNTKVLVLLTDGEDHDGEAVAAAREARRAGMYIFALGVGTPEGEVLRELDEAGNLTYVRDAQGEIVKSQLNEALLQQVAAEGNGFYLPLQAGDAMEVLYQRGLAGLTRTDLAARSYRRYHERFHWPLGVAMILLVAEALLPERTRKRGQPVPAARLNPGAGVAALTLCWSIGLQAASPNRALREFEAGRYEQARQAYEKLLERRPDDPRLRYNAGTAAYWAQDYTNAIRVLGGATTAPDLELQQRAFYNLGDALYRQGEQVPDRQSREDLWRQAVQNYEAALKLNPQDADAEFNLNFVKRKIEELKEQEPPPQDSQPSDQSDQSDQSQQSQQSQQQEQEQEQEQEQSQSQSQEQAGQQEQEQEQEQEQAGQAAAADVGQEPREPQEAPPAQRGMTRQEAQQMLDAVRQEERPLIFQPPEREQRNRSRWFKDW